MWARQNDQCFQSSGVPSARAMERPLANTTGTASKPITNSTPPMMKGMAPGPSCVDRAREGFSGWSDGIGGTGKLIRLHLGIEVSTH